LEKENDDMNQDKYPGVYAAMGEMEMRRHERLPADEMRTSYPERTPMEQTNMGGHAMHTDCIDRETELRDMKLAHAYVPFQKLCPTFVPLTALKKGTIFPGLVGVYGWVPRKETGGEY
jgi:hypothetical protein